MPRFPGREASAPANGCARRGSSATRARRGDPAPRPVARTMARCWSSGFAAPWWTAAGSSGGSGNGRGCSGEPGFRGQGGGWSRARPGVAHVFAFWESRAFYDSFMARSHDRLAAAQAGHVQGRAGQALRPPLRCEDRFRAALHRRGRGAGRPLPGARGARRALRADAGEGLEPGDGRLARHGPGPVRGGAGPRVPGPVHVAVGRRARQVPDRAGRAARRCGPRRRPTSRP